MASRGELSLRIRAFVEATKIRPVERVQEFKPKYYVYIKTTGSNIGDRIKIVTD